MPGILFFDTETSGLWNFKQPLEHDSQPRMIQLAALLTDSTGNELASFYSIIKPNGFEIPQEAAAVHGISTDKAKEWGMDVIVALAAFSQLCSLADTLVAHNIDYDDRILRREYHLANRQHRMQNLSQYCTMKQSTDICRIQGPRGNKWPKLVEAVKHFFNEDLSGAHDAMADVRGCKRVYFHIRGREQQLIDEARKR